jgi:hypothetical protein
MRKVEQVDRRDCANLHNDPCEILQRFPLVHDYLTCEVFEDGSDRKCGTLIIRPEAGAYSVIAKEPAQCLQLRFTAATILEIFVNLEALLGAPRVPWQQDEWEQARRAKPRKKG